LVRRGYESLAGFFHRTWISRIVRRLHIARGMLILDVWCGTAFHLLEFAEFGTNDIGCDFSKGMLQQATKAVGRRRAQIELVLSDSRSLPFRGEAFDIVFSSAVLHHIPNKRFQHIATSEMVRVLRKGGGILVSVANASNLVYWLVRRLSRSLYRGRVGERRESNRGSWFCSKKYGLVYIGKMIPTELAKWLEDAGVRIRCVKYVGPNLPPIGARARTRFHKVLDLYYNTVFDVMDVFPSISLLRLCSTDFYIIGLKPIPVQDEQTLALH